MRNRPQGDQRKSHEYRLVAELAHEILTANSTALSEPDPQTVAEVPAPLSAELPPSHRWRVPVGIAAVTVLAVTAGLISSRRSDRTSALPDHSEQLSIESAKALIKSEGSADCLDPPNELAEPKSSDVELHTITMKIRAYVRQRRQDGEQIGCRTADSSWVGLANDPRMNSRPDLDTRVAMEEYKDESGFKGAVFATLKSAPVFVPGPTRGSWEALNQNFPIGFPIAVTRADDGSVQTRLSTDYPLTRGTLVAMRYDTLAYFLPWSIEQEHPLPNAVTRSTISADRSYLEQRRKTTNAANLP